jgi:hypothetical protein
MGAVCLVAVLAVWGARAARDPNIPVAEEMPTTMPSPVTDDSTRWPILGHPSNVTDGGLSMPADISQSDPYFPRPQNEWRGMRVRRNFRAACTLPDGCGQALACLDGFCGPCRESTNCADGEVCVLDHCVLEALADCASGSECPVGNLCVLSGYSPGRRGNQTLRAFCLGPEGPSPDYVRRETDYRTPGSPAPAPPVSRRSMLEEVWNHRRGAE